MKTSASLSSTGYGNGLPALGGRAGDGDWTPIVGIGTGIVSCRLKRGSLDLSLVLTGGYVACQSASVMGAWRDEVYVVEEDRGDAGLTGPDLEDGREVGGDSVGRLGGSLGDLGGSLGRGELGRKGEDGREWRPSGYLFEFLANSLSRVLDLGIGREEELLLRDDVDDRGD